MAGYRVSTNSRVSQATTQEEPLSPVGMPGSGVKGSILEGHHAPHGGGVKGSILSKHQGSILEGHHGGKVGKKPIPHHSKSESHAMSSRYGKNQTLRSGTESQIMKKERKNTRQSTFSNMGQTGLPNRTSNFSVADAQAMTGSGGTRASMARGTTVSTMSRGAQSLMYTLERDTESRGAQSLMYTLEEADCSESPAAWATNSAEKSKKKSGTEFSGLMDRSSRSSNDEDDEDNQGSQIMQRMATPLRYSGNEEVDSYQIARSKSKEEQKVPDSKCVKIISGIIFGQTFEMFVGFVILANFVAIAVETDMRTRQNEAPKGSESYNHATTGLEVINYCNLSFLMFYIVECVSRIYVMKRTFFDFRWNQLDFALVIIGIAGEVLQYAVNDNAGESMTLLRSMRTLRLLRASRLLISFQELYALACGLLNCMKTLSWAVGLVFFMLTIWAIVAVEYLHPLMDSLAQQGQYDGCTWCSTAFQSILHANLTFFQMITGDGWSHVARPLIEAHPWTALIMIGVIFTMVFGLLNLITAVIVEASMSARQLDIMNLSHAKSVEREDAWRCFTSLTRDLDLDGSGDISLEELQLGIEGIPELRAYLNIMGVEEDDLGQIFELLDDDADGSVSHEDFARQLYKIKTQEVSTGICYIKHMVEDLRRQMYMQHMNLHNTIKHTMQGQIMTMQNQLAKKINKSQEKGGTLKKKAGVGFAANHHESLVHHESAIATGPAGPVGAVVLEESDTPGDALPHVLEEDDDDEPGEEAVSTPSPAYGAQVPDQLSKRSPNGGSSSEGISNADVKKSPIRTTAKGLSESRTTGTRPTKIGGELVLDVGNCTSTNSVYSTAHESCSRSMGHGAKSANSEFGAEAPFDHLQTQSTSPSDSPNGKATSESGNESPSPKPGHKHAWQTGSDNDANCTSQTSSGKVSGPGPPKDDEGIEV